MDTAYHVAQPSMMLEEDVSDEAMSAIDAMFLHGTSLSDFERDEILQYREVFFGGPPPRKLAGGRGAPRNCGFDDASGRYRARLLDHVAYRYKLISMLGKGAFGDCFRAFDFKTSQFVALKIIRNEPRFHRQGKIEVNVLEMLRSHDQDDQYSLVHMEESMLFRNHLVITFELLGDDLYSELKSNNFAGFELPAVRAIAEDTLQCLELLGRLQIVHADLKPENILLRPAEDEDGSGVLESNVWMMISVNE
jgi:dual specificity tyrosine-phosphorylation-regulated kinase 2/3/4